MKRLYLTVEGQTEQAFAVTVLGPHLAKYGIGVHKPRLTGLHARPQGADYPRGDSSIPSPHSLGDIRRWMKEDTSPDAYFSTMVDLYSLPKDFPGYDQASKLTDPHLQAAKLEEALANELAGHRFIPYLQVHEFEALVLADTNCFLRWFDDAQEHVLLLNEECALFDTPQSTINQGQLTHPKARIKKAHQRLRRER